MIPPVPMAIYNGESTLGHILLDVVAGPLKCDYLAVNSGSQVDTVDYHSALDVFRLSVEVSGLTNAYNGQHQSQNFHRAEITNNSSGYARLQLNHIKTLLIMIQNDLIHPVVEFVQRCRS